MAEIEPVKVSWGYGLGLRVLCSRDLAMIMFLVARFRQGLGNTSRKILHHGPWNGFPRLGQVFAWALRGERETAEFLLVQSPHIAAIGLLGGLLPSALE